MAWDDVGPAIERLDADELEPDPMRSDWSAQRATLDEIADTFDAIAAEKDELLEQVEAPEDQDPARFMLAIGFARFSALMHAAGRKKLATDALRVRPVSFAASGTAPSPSPRFSSSSTPPCRPKAEPSSTSRSAPWSWRCSSWARSPRSPPARPGGGSRGRRSGVPPPPDGRLHEGFRRRCCARNRGRRCCHARSTQRSRARRRRIRAVLVR